MNAASFCEEEMRMAHWKEKRARQGFSYEDVLKELERRFKGERILSERKAKECFRTGVVKLNRVYRISAALNDLLDKERLSYEEVLHMTGTPDSDLTLAMLIDPVLREEGQRSLREYDLDDFYPGHD